MNWHLIVLARSVAVPRVLYLSAGSGSRRSAHPRYTGRAAEHHTRVPAGKGIAGRVFRTRRAENTLDVQSDSDHYSRIGIETKTPTQAMLTIPLEDGDVCHGVMQALNPTGRASCDKFDEEVFFALVR